MKRKLFTRTLLLSMFASALLSFTACKSDEDKCKEGDLAACQRTLAKAENDMKLALNAIEKSKNVGGENSSAGSLVDKRDGKKYKTVKIGDQTWMAENLNYKTRDSYCYENKDSNCSKYGRLYEWLAALKACPEGWRLPSRAEFEALFNSVGGIQVAGKSLKSKKGWKNSGNSTDAFGLSALPAGLRLSSGDFDFEGDSAYFWSSTETDSSIAYIMYLDYSDDTAYLFNFTKDYGFSVRCLQD